MALSRRRLLKSGLSLVAGGMIADRLDLVRAASAAAEHHSGSDTTGTLWSQLAPGSRKVVLSGDVTLDVDASVSSLRIPAGSSLTFDPNSARTLTSSGNVVVEGKLRMVSPDPAKIHMLRFKNFDESKFVGGGMDPIPTDVGLWVMGNGVWEACGAPKIGWARCAAAVTAGAPSITLDRDPTGWRVSDELAIAPTRKNGNSEWDYRTIQAIDGRELTLSSPLQFSHPSCDVGDGIVMTPEVLNLTRNVRVEGARNHHAHIFIRSMMPQGDMDDGLCQIQIRWMGPNNFYKGDTTGLGGTVLGRYGLHFHHCKDGSRGTLVDSVVVRDSPAHAFAPHHSHGITFRDCVSHNTRDTAYWWDEGEENLSRAIVYDNCVASRVYGMAGFQLGIVEHLDQHTLTIARMRAKCINCVAIDVFGGNDGTGAFFWMGNEEGVWVFQNCVAHNCEQNGIQIWQNTGVGHVIEDFVAYRNGGHGIKLGAYNNPYEFFRVRCVDNDSQHAPFEQEVTPHVADMGDPRSIGVGSRVTDSYFDASGGPNAYWIASGAAVEGTGSFLVKNCRFKGFTQSAIRVINHNDQFANSMRVEGCTFERADLPQIVLDPNVQSTFTWAIV
jgi:hypothetical protein